MVDIISGRGVGLLEKMRRRVRKCSWERFLESHNGIFDNNDTISRLPETVLHHIMSFLPTLEKDQVRFLSRKWRRIAAQSQKKLSLTRRGLDEQELSKIFVDDFHSVDFLSLDRCSGMKTLKLGTFNLKTVELNYCRSLKTLELNTPHLDTFIFHGTRMRPCRIELGICKKLKVMDLRGVAVNIMMFMDCNKTFPLLEDLTLSRCDMTGSINISSKSLRYLFLLEFSKSIEITVTAPNLQYITYHGSTICSFSNMNVGRPLLADIKLHPSQYQKGNDTWFRNLIEMLQSLKIAERLSIKSNSEKNIIIPEQLRQSLMPPLDEPDHRLVVDIHITSRTGDDIYLVDIADSMLWISPRLRFLSFREHLLFTTLMLVHGDYSRKEEDSCNFCTSHPIRCWRHSVTKFHVTGDYKNSLKCYLNENLQKVERIAIYGPI